MNVRMNHVISSGRFKNAYMCKVNNDYITTRNYRGKSVSAEVAYPTLLLNLSRSSQSLQQDDGVSQIVLSGVPWWVSAIMFSFGQYDNLICQATTLDLESHISHPTCVNVVTLPLFDILSKL